MAVGVVILVSSKSVRCRKNALIGVMYSIVEYGFVKGLCPILHASYESSNPVIKARTWQVDVSLVFQCMLVLSANIFLTDRLVDLVDHSKSTEWFLIPPFDSQHSCYDEEPPPECRDYRAVHLYLWIRRRYPHAHCVWPNNVSVFLSYTTRPSTDTSRRPQGTFTLPQIILSAFWHGLQAITECLVTCTPHVPSFVRETLHIPSIRFSYTGTSELPV